MRFQDMLDRVRRGDATEEEKIAVDEAVEQYEAITAYLEEGVNSAFDSMPEQEGDAAEVKRVSRRAGLRVARITLISIVVIAALVAAAYFGGNLLYFNPNKGYAETYGGDGQFYIDTHAFTELHFPGYSTSRTIAEPKGFGAYDISIWQEDRFAGTQVRYTDRIVRGEVSGNPSDFWHFPLANVFYEKTGYVQTVDADGNNATSRQAPEDRAYYLDGMASLPSACQAAVYVTFDENLTLSQLAEISEAWPDLYIAYAAVKTSDGYMPSVAGFETTGSGIVFDEPPVPVERYPSFDIIREAHEPGADVPAIWADHFKSLLRYMADREDYVEVMGNVNGLSTSYYKEALEYVEANGVQVYGALLQGKAEEMLRFVQQNEGSVYVADAKLPFSK